MTQTGKEEMKGTWTHTHRTAALSPVRGKMDVAGLYPVPLTALAWGSPSRTPGDCPFHRPSWQLRTDNTKSQVDLFFFFLSLIFQVGIPSQEWSSLRNTGPGAREKMGHTVTQTYCHTRTVRRRPLVDRWMWGARRRRDLRLPGLAVVDSFFPVTVH